MAAAGGILVGGAALLWYLSQQQKGGAPSGGATPGVEPAQPGVGGGGNLTVNQGVGLVATGISAAAGVIGALKTAGIIGGAGTGVTAAGGGGGAGGAAGGGAAATAGTIGTGAGIAALPTLGFFAIIWAAIIGAYIGIAISMQVMNRHWAEQNSTLPGPKDLARKLFDAFVGEAVRRDPQGRNPTLMLKPGEIRTIVLTCIWAAAQMWQARNNVLVNYYNLIGRTNPADMASAPFARATPGLNFEQALAGQPDLIAAVLSSWPPYQFSFPVDNSPQGRANWLGMTAPFSAGDLNTAAIDSLGDTYSVNLAQLRFGGAVTGILLPTLEGYGGVQMNWNNWPGDQRFTETIAGLAGWTAVRGAFWVTNTAAPFPLDTWWMVDPATGNRVAPIEAHNDNQLRVSLKGVQMSPGVLSGFGGFAGRRVVGRGARRLGRFGDATPTALTLRSPNTRYQLPMSTPSAGGGGALDYDTVPTTGGECALPDASGMISLVSCQDPRVARLVAANRERKGLAPQGAGSSSLLPLALGAGALALYFMVKKRG